MDLKQLYTTLQGSYDEALGRLMNENLMDKFILKFPSDPTMKELADAIAAGDIETSFRAVHTLKGVAANLAFTGLMESASRLTEQLRPRTDKADMKLYADLQKVYEETIQAIKDYEAQKA